MLKKLVLILSLVLATGAMAEEMACNVAAAEKKLAGPAKQSFLKQCEVTARATCEKASRDQNLAGTAKTNAEKMCLREAMGD